jgi:hypothetical protein
LEEQLEEALAQRDMKHKSAIDIDTPADKTLKLLDKIMRGHEVIMVVGSLRVQYWRLSMNRTHAACCSWQLMCAAREDVNAQNLRSNLKGVV